MSEVFEGVLFRPDSVDKNALLIQAVELARVPLELLELPQYGFAAIVVRNRSEAVFDDDKMEQVAALISKAVGTDILVRRDTRVGFNATMVFENGNLRHVFGPGDELWVPLDDLGKPITSGPTLRLDALDPDEEYDTVVNALDLGFQAYGAGSRDILNGFIYAPDGTVLEPRPQQVNHASND